MTTESPCCATCIHHNSCINAREGWFCQLWRHTPIAPKNPADDPNRRWREGEAVDGML